MSHQKKKEKKRKKDRGSKSHWKRSQRTRAPLKGRDVHWCLSKLEVTLTSIRKRLGYRNGTATSCLKGGDPERPLDVGSLGR
jgi:hypothetical protein